MPYLNNNEKDFKTNNNIPPLYARTTAWSTHTQSQNANLLVNVSKLRVSHLYPIIFDILQGGLTGKLAQAAVMGAGRGAGMRTSYLCISPRPLCCVNLLKGVMLFWKSGISAFIRRWAKKLTIMAPTQNAHLLTSSSSLPVPPGHFLYHSFIWAHPRSCDFLSPIMATQIQNIPTFRLVISIRHILRPTSQVSFIP